MSRTNLKLKIAKAVRVCTVAPVFALVMLMVLYTQVPGFFKSPAHMLVAVLCLCILPVLAYPVSHLFRWPREQFREKQRRLAIIFSLVGYITLLVMAFAAGSTHGEIAVYLNYVFSALVVAVTTAFPKAKASGHACGVAGPAATLIYFVSPWFLLLGLALAAVFWSSLALGRHTLPQLITGSLTSTLFIVVLAAVGFI